MKVIVSRSRTQEQCKASISNNSGSIGMSQKSSPPKTFCYIFTQVKCISVKFRQHVACLYLNIFTNIGQFILILNEMTLIFLGVPIVFNVFSFKFHQVKSP